MDRLFYFGPKGKQEVVQRDGDFYYTTGERVPDELRKGFQTTVFRGGFKPPIESLQKIKSDLGQT